MQAIALFWATADGKEGYFLERCIYFECNIVLKKQTNSKLEKYITKSEKKKKKNTKKEFLALAGFDPATFG